LGVEPFGYEIDIWFSDSDPSGYDVVPHLGIESWGDDLEVDPLFWPCFRQPLSEVWGKHEDLVFPEEAFRGCFFGKPSQRKTLLLADRESAEDRADLLRIELNGMGVAGRFNFPLKGDQDAMIFVDDLRCVGESRATDQ
jgi:hypothetical protein